MRGASVDLTERRFRPPRSIISSALSSALSSSLGLGLLLATACNGHIGVPDGPAGAAASNPSDPSHPTGPGGTVLPPARDPTMAGYKAGEQGLTDRPAPTTRFARLSHTQWANTVRDLFSLDAASTIAADFRTDPAQEGFLFDDNVLALSVDDTLWDAYQRAAADVASQVTGDAAHLSQLLPPDTGDADARAKSFITDFGLRAFRRPLTSSEVDDYVALYKSAAGTYAGLTDSVAGFRLLIEGFLQSPFFIYRVENSATKTGDVIALTSYEVASRLSYMLWNTMPDAELLRAAKAGELELADKVATQAARLLVDPRASDVMASFHAQLLNVPHYATISPLEEMFPKAPAALGTLAAQETDAFVRDVVSSGGGFKELFTSTKSFVNKDLAAVYGLSGSFTDTFSPTTLDATKRKGILTQIGFLASNATSTTPDPIHRGVFVARRILCEHIAAPPDAATPLPPAAGRTNRKTVEDHTQQPDSVCITCHGSIINPLGFPFENYDAIGAYRTMDTGELVNAATDPMVDGEQIHVNDALGLADAIAGSKAAHECYAQHWLEFSYGRPAVTIDDALVQRLGADSMAGKLSVKDLVVGLVKTESFLTRSAEELP